MSLDFGLGDAPPAVSLPPDSGIDAAPETPAAPAPELVALTETFGGDFTGFSSVEDAQRAALLVAQSYAQAGNVAPPQRAPQAAPAPVAPPAPVVEEDYGDLDPKVAARLKQLDADLKQTRAQSQQFQDRLLHEQSMIQQQQNNEVLNQALAAIDSLADPRYGVGGNRTFTQDIARENLLRTADRIVAGMRAAGKNPPSIPKLVQMAVLAETGKLPMPKAAGSGKQNAPPAPVAGGTSQPGGVQQAARRKTGGAVDTYTADSDFMEGARAIVNRNRR